LLDSLHCRLLPPPVGADQVFTQPTRTFTSGLSTDWSPAPPPDMTTGATGKFAWQDFHRLEHQPSFAAARGALEMTERE
jgi:hypothetical protein